MVILSILIVAFIALLSFVVLFVGRNRYLLHEGLYSTSKQYDGPAGEPLWNGTLPDRVDDYAEPRYVYENSVESSEYLPENGRVIGYRISPELVIHSRVHSSLNLQWLSSYISRFGGKLLDLNEVELLLNNWEQVSSLREKAGDTPLRIKSFWALSKQQVPILVDVRRAMYEELSGDSGVWSALVLKR